MNLPILKTNTKQGFSLIELLVVISLFALVAVIVTVSYVGYESREQVKNGALQLVSDLRLAQTKATTGDKVSNSSSGCQTTNSGSPPTQTGNTLAGWYIKFDTTNATTRNQYELGGICLISAVETSISGAKTIKLPKNVEISNITYGTSIFNSTSAEKKSFVFFKPVSLKPTFHNKYAQESHSSCLPTNAPPSFLKSCSVLSGNGTEMVLVVSSSDGGSYEVKISDVGNIQHRKL